MKGSRRLLQLVSGPSLRALLQDSTRFAHSTIPINHHLVHAASFRPIDLLCQLRQSAEDSGIVKFASRPTSSTEKDSLLLSESLDDPGSPKAPRKCARQISEHEYQIRVGKACRVLVDSLPNFMQKGVVDLQDLEPECSSSSATRSGWSARALLPSLSPFLGPSLLLRAAWGQNKRKGKSAEDATPQDMQIFDSLYHPAIAFELRPPLPHIGIGKLEGSETDREPFGSAGSVSGTSRGRNGGGASIDLYDERSRGGPTICFNGRTVYVASSHVLRHALSALFHDTSLHLESARFEGRSRARSSWPGISPCIRSSTQGAPDSDKSSSESWQDKLVIRLRFEGISRVSSHPHTYTVIFKYEFDHATGMIGRHVVDNIQPVPGSKVWAGLTHAWGTLSPAGTTGGSAAPSGGSAACSPKSVA